MQDTEFRTADSSVQEESDQQAELPVIPGKRYFTIGEVSELCQVKSHVLRYWEQEFSKLKPVRRGNRRYYRRQDVLLIRQIRSLLYEQRYTIDGARAYLKGEALKQDSSKYRQLIRQMIAELEDVLDTLDDIPRS
ncbi:MerR family transcriptional regulator [Endozoicomonas gorgoniicola]|uniref:MerR family transcriptional regulator n=1 Tax=Endozoicomonas gorgoniicola TaxID=1234144 RepID=A0ABT3MQ27_9GAMM|nr:MerR family transcriptional regulator [Endozoicomonas gorgoniicola]MCW7551481.1 MerR family transcriptional regulator [Endozoicomonas gorgoniicola]